MMICDDKPSAQYRDEVRRWENGCAADDEGVKQKLGLFQFDYFIPNQHFTCFMSPWTKLRAATFIKQVHKMLYRVVKV